MKKNKGISLIVLVITIIVMIILAGTIILVLNSSNIVGKSKEATHKSNVSNLREAVNLAKAEYELSDKGANVKEYVQQYLNNNNLNMMEGYDISEKGDLVRNNWKGDIDTTWYTDTNNEFSISSPKELAGLAKLVNEGNNFSGKTINLADDMHLSSGISWVPIGTISNPFSGIFNGNGHVISGIYIKAKSSYQGLFGHMKNSQISGVILKEGYVEALSNVGGLVGYVTGVDNIIKDCSNLNTTVNSTGAHIGGLVGQVLEESISTLENLYNTGTVTGGYEGTGGVTGRLGLNSKLSNSYNTGNIKVKSKNQIRMYGGGVVGVNRGTTEYSYNLGKIENYSSGYYAYSGGIAGQNGGGIIQFCYNSGIVTNNGVSTTGGGYNTGGISGNNTGSTAIITNCYNTGLVRADGEIIGSSAHVGGITGWNGAGCIVSNSYNFGKVVNNASGTSRFTGEILGYGNEIGLANNYYKEGIESLGGVTGEDIPGKAEKKTEEFMKSEAFVILLNFGTDKWEINSNKNNGFPVFK
ncbi:MAG: hypothetical protein PHR25_05625 [Clostridia bacterium]|nr:hypothetical protein [Clostridia bacterium]MDD4376245.1 hypothetical protein [Clostridia bacterium]